MEHLHILVLLVMVVPSPGHSYIYAQSDNQTSMVFEDLPSLFGTHLPREGLKGVLVESQPRNACSPIKPPPLVPSVLGANVTKVIVLIRRNDCNFDQKVLHAQQAGYSAAIVYNVNSDILLSMGYSNETIADEIEIPSVFTSFSAFQMLEKFVIPASGAYVILWPEFSFPLSYYLIPFTGVMGIILIIMIIVLVVRCMQHRKRMRKNRLTKEQLKKIPVHKFSKGDEYDMCAICLDDYEDGDKLRILPCSHAYHCKCVDPWLTKTKKTCPVCKQRVTGGSSGQPDSESEDEERVRGGGDDEEDEDNVHTERTPLLRPGSPSSSSALDYSSTAAPQGLASNSPLLTHEDYYSPEEDSEESEESEEEDDTDTVCLIGRGNVQV